MRDGAATAFEGRVERLAIGVAKHVAGLHDVCNDDVDARLQHVDEVMQNLPKFGRFLREFSAKVQKMYR